MGRIAPFGERMIEDFGPRVGHFWLGQFADVLFLALLVVGAIIIVRMFLNRPQAQTSATVIPEKPLQILEERFAKGEIDEEEFRARRDALRG